MIQRKNIFLETSIICSVAIMIASINFLHGINAIKTYAKDNNLVLGPEEVFNRVFINLDFVNIEYMEGNNPIHYTGPFIFFLATILIGSYTFLTLKKPYYQFLFTRARTKQYGVALILKGYFFRVTLFTGIYISGVILMIFHKNLSTLIESPTIIRQSIGFFLASTLISAGLTLTLYSLFTKFDEVKSIVVVIIILFITFGANIQFPHLSIVFLGEDEYFKGGIFVGGILLFVSYFVSRVTKFEIK